MGISLKDFYEIWEQIAGTPAGVWLLIIVVILLVLNAIKVIADAIEAIKSKIIPLFYSKDDKRREQRRARFAEQIEQEIRRINSQEEWRDYRFTELDAEIETTGATSIPSRIFPFIFRKRTGLRRVGSLSDALRTSKEPLILLEGEPGAGKSVALRHLALDLAEKSRTVKLKSHPIPLYINLKRLERPRNRKIDSALIEEFILAQLCNLNDRNDRDIDVFLDDEFKKGLAEGGWLFLFDSFDEIPEILGATDLDQAVRSYSEAIYNFFHGMNMNTCRGIVASRYFRGPTYMGWPRFRIAPLTETQQRSLILKNNLSNDQERTLFAGLNQAPDEILQMVGNPLFLSMVVEHIRSGHTFPEDTYSVFKTYLDSRLTRDRDRLARKFKLQPEEVRSVAEEVAFCMACDQHLGLNPTRESIFAALTQYGFAVNRKTSRSLDALEFIKLGRAEIEAVDEERTFTFSHRRFQEFFATQIVLRWPDRISTKDLLTQPYWREAAVVILQVYPDEKLQPFFETIIELLSGYKEQIYASLQKIHSDYMDFPWPTGALHLLSILQDGFSMRRDSLPIDIRQIAEWIITKASTKGFLLHQKWALEVAASIPDESFVEILRFAIDSKSQLITNSAYDQIARLDDIPTDLAKWVAKSITKQLTTGTFFENQDSNFAYLARLKSRPNLLKGFMILMGLPKILFAIGIVSLTPLSIWSITLAQGNSTFFSVFITSIVLASIYVMSFVNHRSLRAFFPIGSMFALAVIGLLVINTSILAMIVIAICIYLLTLPYSLLRAYEKGEVITRYSWPIYPFIAFAKTMRGLASDVRENLQRLGEKRKLSTSYFVRIVVFFLAALYIGLTFALPSIPGGGTLSTLMILLMIIGATVTGIFFFLKSIIIWFIGIPAQIRDRLFILQWKLKGEPVVFQNRLCFEDIRAEANLLSMISKLRQRSVDELEIADPLLANWISSVQSGHVKNKRLGKQEKSIDEVTHLLEQIRAGNK